MNTSERSLRSLVEKWLAPTRAAPIRVTRFSHARSDHCRCIRVETLRQGGLVVLFFFQHDDGSWSVYPPDISRPRLRVSQGEERMGYLWDWQNTIV
jgi:hypothetical protein